MCLRRLLAGLLPGYSRATSSGRPSDSWQTVLRVLMSTAAVSAENRQDGQLSSETGYGAQSASNAFRRRPATCDLPAPVPTVQPPVGLAQSEIPADVALSGLRLPGDRPAPVHTLDGGAVGGGTPGGVGAALVAPGTTVRHRHDTRWRGTILGESTEVAGTDGIWLLVQWRVPERFVGLTRPQDLVVTDA